MINAEYNGVHSWLREYIIKCKSGEETIGHELMMELDRLLGLFDDQTVTVEFDEAHKRIRFIEKECKHFEAPFAGKPFILELFQKAFIEAIYIFKIYDDEVGRLVRLHQEILFLVARKNGKTPLVSAICLAEFVCGPKGIKILCSSNDYEQADLMFQAINAMREESLTVEKVTRKNMKGIYFGNPRKPKKHGKFSYENKGSIRKISAKTGAKEGRNIGVGAVDEVHELKDDSSVMPILQGLSTQDEPLYFELTTEGVINDGYLDKRIAQARKVLAGELERPRWLIWLYTQDSEQEIWQDKKSWKKSNPGIGIIKKWSYLEGMVEKTKEDKGTRVLVLSKDFNIKQNHAEAWMNEEEYTNEEIINWEELRGCIGIGGIDLSETTDLTNARLMIVKPGSTKKYCITKYFIPESKIEKGQSEDKKNYLEWAKYGLIEVSPGNENDYSKVVEWFVSLYKQYGIRIFRIGYDNWQMKELIKTFEDTMGIDTERVKMEDYYSMSDPMKLCGADFGSGLIVYDNNPVDRWCLGNTAMKVNDLGQIRPIKIKDAQYARRIDGAVTFIICYAIYNRYRTEYLEAVG